MTKEFGIEKLKEAGLRAIKLLDTVEDSLENRKIEMDEWWRIGTAGVSVTYIFKNGAALKQEVMDLDAEEKAELIAYWKDNMNVGVDDEAIYKYVLDCIAYLYDVYIRGKLLVKRGKELFGNK